MTIYIIRASHANQYELQNYSPIVKKCGIKLITSQHPLTSTSISTIKLWSPADLPSFPYRRQFFNRLIGGEQWLLGLEKIVKSDDVLHTAETYTPYTHQAVQLRKHNKIKKLICTCWETIPFNNEKFSRLRYWKKEAYHYVDLFHVPTIRAQNALEAEGVSPKKIIHIPYGVDRTRFISLRHKHKSHPLIITPARRVKEKGIAIYQKVRNALNSVADFRWISDISYAQMPKLYQNADILYLPSLTTPTWEEQYGMVLIEAMSSGLPIVTTNSGAIPEIVGQNALLSDPLDYSSQIINLLSLIQDPNKYKEYSDRSLLQSKFYNCTLASQKLAGLYYN